MISKLYHKASTLFIAAIASLLFLLTLYIFYIKPPEFRQQVEGRLIDNTVLVASIGGWDTIEFNYSKNKKYNNTFYVKLNGKCKGAYIILNGLYNNNDYTVNDTIVKKCQ